jgi:hypothetical protein
MQEIIVLLDNNATFYTKFPMGKINKIVSIKHFFYYFHVAFDATFLTKLKKACNVKKLIYLLIVNRFINII